jgi:hypothetical protein
VKQGPTVVVHGAIPHRYHRYHRYHREHINGRKYGEVSVDDCSQVAVAEAAEVAEAVHYMTQELHVEYIPR